MALLISTRKAPDIARNTLGVIVPKLVRYSFRDSNERTVTLVVDPVDEFTTQLLHRKTIKWETYKWKTKAIIQSIDCDKELKLQVDIWSLTDRQIDSLFSDFIEEADNKRAVCLMKECIKCKYCPQPPVLFYVLNQSSLIGDKETIEDIKHLCEKLHPKLLEINSNFEHFKAQAIWVKGNIKRALELFEELYKENALLRRRIRLMIKYLITDVILQNSEAVLVSIIDFSERMAKDYRDFHFLTCIWRICFLSEWFSDQCRALELLDRNTQLSKGIIRYIPAVVSHCLKNHQTESVYRLLEVLLKYNMQQHIPLIVIPLFDYQVQQGDLRSCNAIIDWSVDNDIRIPFILSERYIKLIGKSESTLIKEKLAPKEQEPPSYTLKF